MVTVITEVGDVIELTGALVNGGPVADAYVADQREFLGLPEKPMKANEAIAFKLERDAMRRQAAQLSEDLAENATKPPLRVED